MGRAKIDLKIGDRIRVMSTTSLPKHYTKLIGMYGKVTRTSWIPAQNIHKYGVEIYNCANERSADGTYWFTGWELENIDKKDSKLSAAEELISTLRDANELSVLDVMQSDIDKEIIQRHISSLDALITKCTEPVPTQAELDFMANILSTFGGAYVWYSHTAHGHLFVSNKKPIKHSDGAIDVLGKSIKIPRDCLPTIPQSTIWRYDGKKAR